MPSLNYPSRNDVDLALTELEQAEKERTRKAIAYVNAHRHTPIKHARLWQVASLLLLMFFFGWWWLSGALRSIGLP